MNMHQEIYEINWIALILLCFADTDIGHIGPF